MKKGANEKLPPTYLVWILVHDDVVEDNALQCRQKRVSEAALERFRGT